jgi:hypothetical protein
MIMAPEVARFHRISNPERGVAQPIGARYGNARYQSGRYREAHKIERIQRL